MPDAAGRRSGVAQTPSAPAAESPAPLTEGSAAADVTSAGPKDANGETAVPAGHRLFFGLGVGVQTLLWFFLFLALVVAVAVGGELTEFRYVGF